MINFVSKLSSPTKTFFSRAAVFRKQISTKVHFAQVSNKAINITGMALQRPHQGLPDSVIKYCYLFLNMGIMRL